MSWQRSIQAAVRNLRKAETALERQLELTRTKIQELEALAQSGPPTRKKTGRRRLSDKGRAAISRAAKRRWAQYRAEQRKKGK